MKPTTANQDAGGRHATLTAVLDRDFLQQRANLLELAAFLDRCERAGAAPLEDEGIATGADEPRLKALREAMKMLLDGRAERTRRVLEFWSDPGVEPIARPPIRGVTGVDLRD